MAELGRIINSLLKSKILKRDPSKEKNDQTMHFFLNQEFNCHEENISLVNITHEPKPQTKPIDNFAIAKTNIITQLKKKNQVPFQELFETIKSDIPFTFTEQQFKMCINLLKSEGLLNQSDTNILEYLEKN